MIQRSVTKGNVTNNRNENAIVEDIRELVALANNPAPTGPLTYSATLTQEYPTPPSATVVCSDISPISINKVVAGIYDFEFASGVLTSKTEVHITNGITPTFSFGLVLAQKINNTTVRVYSSYLDVNTKLFTLADNLIYNASFTIKVYP